MGRKKQEKGKPMAKTGGGGWGNYIKREMGRAGRKKGMGCGSPCRAGKKEEKKTSGCWSRF